MDRGTAVPRPNLIFKEVRPSIFVQGYSFNPRLYIVSFKLVLLRLCDKGYHFSLTLVAYTGTVALRRPPDFFLSLEGDSNIDRETVFFFLFAGICSYIFRFHSIILGSECSSLRLSGPGQSWELDVGF